MPKRPRCIPKYRHCKPKNLGVVRIGGKDEYLGRYNSPESLEKYHRLIAEWLSNGRASVRSPNNLGQGGVDLLLTAVQDCGAGRPNFSALGK